MGSSQSSLSPPALHVLRVTPNSPAAHAHIEPFFDYIVGLAAPSAPDGDGDGAIEPDSLGRIVEAYEGRTLSLRVYSAKTQSTRLVSLTPSRAWSLPHAAAPTSAAGPDAQPSLLGLSLRVCDPAQALEHVWHVLDVMEGSPAESAGLVPYGDWIVGWSGGSLSAESDFYDLVEAHVEKPLRVYVYSYDFDSLREVVLIPNRHWGGSGLLGCGVGYGLLHRIPRVEPHVDVSVSAPYTSQAQYGLGKVQEEEGEAEEGMFVPADLGGWRGGGAERAVGTA